VEAEPDVKAAMDILSFALYHENNDELASKIAEDERAADVSDDGDEVAPPSSNDGDSDSGGDEPSKKRMRLDKSAKASLKSRIWEQIVESQGQSLEEITRDADKLDEVLGAINELEQEDRIIRVDNMLYPAD
jgi:hypothetical protein